MRALAVVVALLLAACSGSTPSSSTTTTTTTTTTAVPEEWVTIDRGLEALGPNVGFLAARVDPDGSCAPIHAVAPTTVRPTASQFKLFVLGALAEAITDGEASWDQTLTVTDALRSLGNGEGSLQLAETGTVVTIEEVATSMISISDNTATDMLIDLLGRDAVEEQAGRWVADAARNDPFLTTREMLLLHYAAGLGERYLATPPDEREAFLATEVAPLPIGEVGTAYSTDPRFIDEIEWFAAPDDVCGAFAGLQQLAGDPALAPLDAVLSQEVAGIGLDPETWPTVWYKGGSEAGVLTLGWLATNSDGETFVVEAMVSNPDAALADDAITDLVALAQDAFALLD